MGGSDPANQTTRILNLLIQSTKRHIDAVFGHGYKDKNEIDAWEENEQITTHYAKSNLHEIMSNAKFSICGAGTMIYELAYMGVPTLSLSLIEYQRIVANSINERNATLYLGHFNEVSDQEIINQIKLRENRFGFEPEVTAKIGKLAKKDQCRIYEVGISYYGRTYKEGKKINWKDGLSALRCIIRYNLF